VALGGKGVSGRVNGEDLLLASPKAITERAPLSSEQVSRIQELNDEGKSVSVLAIGNAVAGAIAMRDEPRADALRGLMALQAAGIRTVMLRVITSVPLRPLGGA